MNWKKKLNDEFEKSVPALRDDVKNAPIDTVAASETVQNGNALVRRQIGIGSAFVAAFVVLTIILLAVLGVFSPKTVDEFVFTYEINPSVAFVTDKDGKVLSVNALNSDADIVLSDSELAAKLKDVPLSQAIVAYTDAAAKLGYIDFSEHGDAVRLSGLNESANILASSKGALENYFKSHGIYAAVINDGVSSDELLRRAGMSGVSGVSDLADTLKNSTLLLGERISQNASKEELTALYESYVIGARVTELVHEELAKNISSINRNAGLLMQIVTLNTEIMTHSDNPSLILKDYWSVKKLHENDYSPEFSALMEDMTSLLDEYEAAFDKVIDSATDLKFLFDIYDTFAGNLSDVISSLNSIDFISSPTKYLDVLKNANCDVSMIENLMTVPDTVAEYLDVVKSTTNMFRAKHAEEFKKIYDSARDEITDSDYAKFIEKMQNDYGSLSDYWNELNS